MLTNEELEYELNYWKLTYTKHTTEKYMEYLLRWHIPLYADMGKILEIGTGPFYGILPFVDGDLKVGMDPNYRNFESLHMLRNSRFILRFNSCIEDDNVRGEFDNIVMADGVEAIKKGALLVIKRLLAYPHGKLYLHLHLRRGDQLTPGHKIPFLMEDLTKAIREANLREVWQEKYSEDPIPQYTNGNRYETIMGVWIG